MRYPEETSHLEVQTYVITLCCLVHVCQFCLYDYIFVSRISILNFLLQGTLPPLLVTQHQHAPRQLVLLSANGAHILTFQRPVDKLRYLLEEANGVEASLVKDFFTDMTPTQACTTALIIATDPNIQNTQVRKEFSFCSCSCGSLFHLRMN